MRVIVTGATGDLGRATLAAFHSAGHRVACIARSAARSLDEQCRFVEADLASPEQAGSGVRRAVEWLGGLDVLVHLVGGFAWKRVEESSLADWRSLYAANLETTLNTIQACLPLMQEGGAIVTVGAASTRSAGEGEAAYTASKSAVSRLTEALARELSDRRIRVNTVLPSIIDTAANREAMPDVDPTKLTSPAAIADVIHFLATPAARAINGVSIPVTNAA